MDNDRERERFARAFADEGLPGRLLSREDFAEAPGSREVVAGRTPTFQHLRDGCFLDRPKQLASALEAVEGVLKHCAPNATFRWHALRIEGPSGSGKSVFLLQLVRELVQAHGWLVIWLGQNGADLVPVAQAWHRLAPAIPACIALDYDPGNLGTSSELSQTCGNAESKPLILTTSPPADLGLRSVTGFRVAIQSWRLPPPTVKEVPAVRAWYVRWTGKAPAVPPAPPADPQKRSMATLLCELEHGDLEACSRRLARTLESAGLAELLRLPLALNQHELWAPGSWLSAEDLEQLERIGRNADPQLLAPELPRPGVIRLTHPLLAAALLRALLPDPAAPIRELGRAFAKALDAQDPTWKQILWQPQIQKDEAAFAHLVDCGLAWLSGKEEGPHWSAVWKSLFDAAHYVRDLAALERLAAKGLIWLGSRQAHPDWMTVFYQLPGRRRGSWTTSAAKGEMGEVLGRWLRHPPNQAKEDWAFHLEQYSKAGFASEDLLEPLGRWLGSHQQDRYVPLMAAELLVRRIDRPELATTAEWLAGWLEGHSGFVEEQDIRDLFRKRLKPGKSRPPGWERLAGAVSRIDATFSQVGQLIPKWKSGEAVAGHIVARREGGFSVKLGLVKAYMPDRLLGAAPDDSWIGWAGSFEIENIFDGPGLVIVGRQLGTNGDPIRKLG